MIFRVPMNFYDGLILVRPISSGGGRGLIGWRWSISISVGRRKILLAGQLQRLNNKAGGLLSPGSRNAATKSEKFLGFDGGFKSGNRGLG